jgi:hypothetical protein
MTDTRHIRQTFHRASGLELRSTAEYAGVQTPQSPSALHRRDCGGPDLLRVS